MHWVYILRCEDDYFYVGETKRLYRRFREHLTGNGGSNTCDFNHEEFEIAAIYKVPIICQFISYNKYVTNILDGTIQEGYRDIKLKYFGDEECDELYEWEYDHLFAENNIVECMMVHDKDNSNTIRGGKYTRFNVNYKSHNNILIKDLPLCNCGLPCDIKKNATNNFLYFRCAKKNMWDGLKDNFVTYDPCNFYKEYTKDKQLKTELNNKFQERKKKLRELIKQSDWLKNVPCEEDGVLGECVSCNTYVWSDRQGEFKNNGIIYCNDRRLLCFDCFIDQNKVLSTKYTGICQLDLS
jgi:hypothetical protein